MKIDNSVGNLRINHSNTERANQIDREKETGGQGTEKKSVKSKGCSIKARSLNMLEYGIEDKKQKAMKDAMEFVKEQFKSDTTIDNALKECREQTEQSKSELKEAQHEIETIQEEREKLKEEYGGDIENKEYQERVAVYDKKQSEVSKTAEKASGNITSQARIINGVKKEMVKYHGMDDATNAAEKTLKASTKEITGMLVQEATEHVDKEIEEQIEQGKQQKAENEEVLQKAEKAETLQNVQAETEKIAARAEESTKPKQSGNGGTKQFESTMNEISQKMSEINEKTAKIVEEQKLLMEDIKGAMVDCIL
ncbi:MAG: hypothetical protein RR139_06245 [Lachnospiraceae bacterium]